MTNNIIKANKGLNLTEMDEKHKILIPIAVIIVLSLFVIFFLTDFSTIMENGFVSSRKEEWSLSNSEIWDQGYFEDTELTSAGDSIRLEAGASEGTWHSEIKEWDQEVEFIEITTDTKIDAGNIEIELEISDDGFNTIKDNWSVEPSGGIEGFELQQLSKAKQARLNVRIEFERRSKSMVTFDGASVYVNKA